MDGGNAETQRAFNSHDWSSVSALGVFSDIPIMCGCWSSSPDNMTHTSLLTDMKEQLKLAQLVLSLFFLFIGYWFENKWKKGNLVLRRGGGQKKKKKRTYPIETNC